MTRISGPFRVCTGIGALALALSAGGCVTTRYEVEDTPSNVPAQRPAQAPDTAAVQSAQDTLSGQPDHPGSPSDLDSLKTLSASQAQKLADLEAVNAELSGKLAVLNDRLGALEDRVQASASPPQPPPPARTSRGRRKAPPPASSSVSRVKTVYQTALRDFEARHFDSALKGFSEALTLAPKDDLADNAQYWIGECHWGMGNYARAIKEFQKVFTYPDTEKDDDAQFKIARCYADMGDAAMAIVELKRLTVDYPESEYVRRAEGLLRDLQDQRERQKK